MPMRGTVCAYHGKSEGYYRSTACRNVCIHCGKRNGIQLSYGTGAGKECVAAVYVGTAAVCSIKTDFVDRTEWDSHLLQWRS